MTNGTLNTQFGVVFQSVRFIETEIFETRFILSTSLAFRIDVHQVLKSYNARVKEFAVVA